MTDSLLKRPHITEKSAIGSERDGVHTYTFEVPATANKAEVAKAVVAAYKVKPVRVNMVTIPSKTTYVRGKRATKPGYKKAIVFLKKGDTIAFV